MRKKLILKTSYAIGALLIPTLFSTTATLASEINKDAYQLNLFNFNVEKKSYSTDSDFGRWLIDFKPDALLFQEDTQEMAELFAQYLVAQNNQTNNVVGQGRGDQRLRSLIGGVARLTPLINYEPAWVQSGFWPWQGYWSLNKVQGAVPTVRVTMRGDQEIDVLTAHFKGDDRSVGNNAQRNIAADAREINNMINGMPIPMVLTGDFNAGDVSATGLRPNQTYPSADNYPITMNIIKNGAQLFQSESQREPFRYLQDSDGSYTWPNVGANCTAAAGCWGSSQRWDRVRIDHFVINRPYAKWFFDNKSEEDLAADLALREINRGGVLSDHSHSSAKMGWVMPVSKEIESGNSAAGISLTFDINLQEQSAIAGNKAPWYNGEKKEFYLSRTNNRSDVYLGQISDENGKPTLTQADITNALNLGDPEIRQQLALKTGLDFDNDANAVFKIQLDCSDTGHLSLSGASAYCTDDHSRFKAIDIKDGQTVVYDEEAALGDIDGVITLNDGGLRTKGSDDLWAINKLAIDTITRAITLNGNGWINITDIDDVVTANGIISGEGNFIKRGNGILVLNAANVYKGNTTIEAGILRAGSANSFVQNQAYIINNGTLDLNDYDLTVSSLAGLGGNVSLGSANLTINQDIDTEFYGNITGTGGLNKASQGTIILNGSNSYKGDTNIFAGKVQFGNGSHENISDIGGNINVNAAATLAIFSPSTVYVDKTISLFENSILEISDSRMGSSNFGNLTAQNIVIQDNVTFNLSGINENSAFNRVLFSANEGIDGEFKTINIGGFNGEVDYLNLHVKKSNDGTKYYATYDLSWYANTSSTHGTFTLANSENHFTLDTVLSDVISNNGNWDGKSLTKMGQGTLILNQDNTYSGQTIINAGTLQLGNGANSGSVIGEIINNGTLAINRNDENLIVSQAISGSGNVKLIGNGTTIFSATNSYAGSTDINAGKLILGASKEFANSAQIAGNVNISSGATLAGHGRVLGHVQVLDGGIISPGNSIGTLTVGSITFDKGSTYGVEMNASGNSDLIKVMGRATINGGKIEILSSASDWDFNKIYTFIDADGGISGSFDTIDAASLFLTARLIYTDPQKLQFGIVRDNQAFINVGTTHNQKNTGYGIAKLNDQHDILQAMLKFTDEHQARTAYDNLSGEIYSSTRSGLILNNRYLRDALNKRMLSESRLPSTEPIWFSMWGHGGKIDGNHNAASINNKGWGLALGFDGEVNDNLFAGIALGYDRGEFDGGRNSKSEADSFHVSGYGATEFNTIKLRSGVSYSYIDGEASRNIWVPGLRSEAKSDINGWQVQLFADMSKDFKLSDNAVLSPYANIAHIWLNLDDIKERNSNAALHSHGDRDNITFTTLGIRSELQIATLLPVALYGDIGWQHAFGDIDGKIINNFQNTSTSFAIKGVGIDEDMAIISTGFNVRLNENNTISLGYNGQLGSKTKAHAATAEWKVRF
ncbi:autotransporter domain-containing protein [Bartonella sp. HY406]|uniref:autotransporter domain-containing protein n=1 Tax=Bartonella sp. HY406 TaxID=2979331 RepID=UPI0021C5BDEE|nr:autotransporter domain-containing protein [Bartonella sp. HY406]UXN03990.1 autotransporter domain-containing protein [Bartonella sp. HY406]